MADLKIVGTYDDATEKLFRGQTAQLPVYTVVQLLAIDAKPAGMLAFASNANAGAGAVVYSDGVIWKDVKTSMLVV